MFNTNNYFEPGKITVLMDAQAGSSGKGKIGSFITEHANNWTFACNAFFPNAGHWVRTDNRGDYFYQTLNSCAYQANFKPNFEAMYIGPGAIIELPALFHELEVNPGSATKLKISPLAVILQEKDTLFERGLVNFEGEPFKHDGTYRYGSTSHGVGAANARRVLRRKDVIYAKDVAELAPFLCDTTVEILKRLDKGESGLLEVAQGFQLSLLGRFAPNCTSRNVTAVQALSDMMLPPSVVGNVVFNFRTFPIRINSNKYVGDDGTHLTWEQVQSGVPHNVLRGDSGGWYPDQKEISWEELTELSGSPEKIMEITSVTKLPRRVATFSKMNAEEVLKLNYFGDHVKYYASINFVNYLDYGLTGLRSSVHSDIDEELRRKLTTFTDWYFENLPGCYDDLVSSIMLGTGPKTDDVIFF